MGLRAVLALAVGSLAAPWGSTAASQTVAPYAVEGDAIAAPLTDMPGDVQRGRAIVASRQTGLCLLCHTGPIPEERFQGNLAPDLGGAGSRYSTGQLRLRIADSRRVHAASFMPSFHADAQPARVGAVWAGRPILTAQQVEDVVAYLATLR